MGMDHSNLFGMLQTDALFEIRLDNSVTHVILLSRHLRHLESGGGGLLTAVLIFLLNQPQKFLRTSSSPTEVTSDSEN